MLILQSHVVMYMRHFDSTSEIVQARNLIGIDQIGMSEIPADSDIIIGFVQRIHKVCQLFHRRAVAPLKALSRKICHVLNANSDVILLCKFQISGKIFQILLFRAVYDQTVRICRSGMRYRPVRTENIRTDNGTAHNFFCILVHALFRIAEIVKRYMCLYKGDSQFVRLFPDFMRPVLVVIGPKW